MSSADSEIFVEEESPAKTRSPPTRNVPAIIVMDVGDIESPAPPQEEYDWQDEEEEGVLLRCFTVASGCCAAVHNIFLRQWLSCGNFVRDRRFWLCKIIIVVMDAAILRGSFSMAEEYCDQDDEISEFGWVLWSSFLVFCKFVYLRPVFHLHQLGVFHSSRWDAVKSAFLELLCVVCHILMLLSLMIRTVEPGFAAFRSGTCESRGRELVRDPITCSLAAKWYSLTPDKPITGDNKTKPLSHQPPGCFFAQGEKQLYFNQVICSHDEDWCEDWLRQNFGQCTKESTCLCLCEFFSASIVMSIIIFALPMPVQWRMLSSSLTKIAERPHDSNEHNASDISDINSQNQRNQDDGLEGIEMQTRSGTTDANVDEHQQESDEAEGTQISPELYSKCMEDQKCQGLEGFYSKSSFADSEKGSDNVGSHQRMKRLHKELKSLPKQLEQHPNSSIWIRYDQDRPQYMRAAITGPSGTPYESGVFLFDLYFPPSYPLVPPKMLFLTTAHGTIRFNPNLYADGKVCLSLLGTFDGPKWDPGSSLYQVLVSIQGMILGAPHPILNEPGLGGFERQEGAAGGRIAHVCDNAVRAYDERVQLATLQHAILGYLRKVPDGFEEAIQLHFYMMKASIMSLVKRWREEAEKFREEHGAAQLQEDFLDRLQELHALLAASLNAVREPATYRRLADAEAAGRAAAARAVEERGGDEVEGSEGEGMEEDKMLEEDRDDIQLLPGASRSKKSKPLR
uniref:UBC core domain-containing protein n=1 Tax=Hanusia phi TaxID=3032 RepID=A0A7S0EJ03_9CRYP|mmetsp:Transcript_2502/g.6011  ORF Transcript_2502/g.6011 Transcript_2502/m.6011 type:complete len:737 (+) Transcript_2502:137-2347(+)